MKKIKLNTGKLFLNKEKIVNLTNSQMKGIAGGLTTGTCETGTTICSDPFHCGANISNGCCPTYGGDCSDNCPKSIIISDCTDADM